MRSSLLRDDILALAGIFQAGALVRQAAWKGEIDPSAFQTSIESIFRLNPESASEVFGKISNLAPGLRSLRGCLGRDSGSADDEVTAYVAGLMLLERKLARSSSMQDKIRQGVRSMGSPGESEISDQPVTARLAQLYGETISRLNPRIMVRGAPEYLEDPATTDKVRALLLAGIRAAVLWRQVGGTRMTLLFGRKRAVAAAEDALRSGVDDTRKPSE